VGKTRKKKEDLWQKLVKAKYLKGKPIACLEPRQGTQVLLVG
jgi:hypothetical protein